MPPTRMAFHGQSPIPIDRTHEVKNSGWVNHEPQNYVNHEDLEGKLVTELRNGKLCITALKGERQGLLRQSVCQGEAGRDLWLY